MPIDPLEKESALLHAPTPKPLTSQNLQKAALLISGCKCRLARMSVSSSMDIEVLNPLADIHWVRIHRYKEPRKRTEIDDAQNAILARTSCALLQCDRSCKLKELIHGLMVHVDAAVLRRGSLQIELLATGRDLRRFMQRISAANLRYKLLHVLDLNREMVGRGLTTRQLDVIRTALKFGYYEYPKKVTLARLVELLGRSPSTLSETLRRAEKTIIKETLLRLKEQSHSVLALMTADVLTASEGTTIRDAVHSMYKRGVGSIVVVDDAEKCVGIYTERDLLKNMDEKRSLDTPLRDVMTWKPITVRPTTKAFAALRIMLSHKIRHLPVVDENGRLVGICSIRDLLRKT